MAEEFKDERGYYVPMRCRCYYTFNGVLDEFGEDCEVHKNEKKLLEALRDIKNIMSTLPRWI